MLTQCNYHEGDQEIDEPILELQRTVNAYTAVSPVLVSSPDHHL